MNKYTIKNFVDFIAEWLKPLPRMMLDGAIWFGAWYIVETLIGGLAKTIKFKLKEKEDAA